MSFGVSTYTIGEYLWSYSDGCDLFKQDEVAKGFCYSEKLSKQLQLQAHGSTF